jgi:hypothetical protein
MVLVNGPVAGPSRASVPARHAWRGRNVVAVSGCRRQTRSLATGRSWPRCVQSTRYWIWCSASAALHAYRTASSRSLPTVQRTSLRVRNPFVPPMLLEHSRLVRRGGAAAQRMIRRHLHDADTDSVRVGDPHLQQPPRLPPRLLQDRHATLAELPPRHGQVPYLQPQRHAVPRRPSSAAGHLQEAATQEEHRAPLQPAAELAVDRQPQRVAVEGPAAFRVGWAQQHTAAQHVHGAIIAQQTTKGATPCAGP